MAIKILVDSASDIDVNEAKNLGIEMIPMEVTFGDEEYLDGVNLSHKEFFEKLIETNIFPKTSQINEYRFNEKFEEMTKDGSEVLCITMSSKLSGTFNSAKEASKKYNDKVVVIDSNNVCIGERILIFYAIRLLKQNISLKKIVDNIEEKKNKIQLVALLNTLKYLQKGGRISMVKAFAGELMSLKPVVSVIDGEVKLTGKAIGSKKGNNLLMQMIAQKAIDFDMPYVVGYSGLEDSLLKKYLEDSKSIWEEKAETIPSFSIGSTIGTHVGPGAIAVAYFSKD